MVEMTTKKRTSNPALSVAGSCKGNLKPKVACMEDIIFCITPGDCCQSQGQLGSNANVADGGIRKGTRSDEIRPVIRRWPLPPLRPKRAASGVAGLRYGRGQRKTNHALMSETPAGKPQPEAIPLNIHGNFSFFCPIFLGHLEASGFCFQSERLLYGREPKCC